MIKFPLKPGIRRLSETNAVNKSFSVASSDFDDLAITKSEFKY